MNGPQVQYRSLPDTTPQTEITALSAVYRFVIEASHKKRPPAPVAPTTRKGDLMRSGPRPVYLSRRTEPSVCYSSWDAA